MKIKGKKNSYENLVDLLTLHVTPLIIDVRVRIESLYARGRGYNSRVSYTADL